MTLQTTWRFRTMEDDQKHVEPTHREHLAPGGAVEPLVREAIQNSLDVTIDKAATRVVFTLGEVGDNKAGIYFDKLWPHLDAITKSLPEGMPNRQDPISYLSIEDYNTLGLEGDVNVRNELNADLSKNHFFRFWHRVGPADEFKRRGSWGVGKVVFSNASRIRTFFGLTKRMKDPTPLLMGEAGLTIHRLRNSKETYDWYGYYANHESQDNHYTLSPITGQQADEFAKIFSLDRSVPGLSIVVPYVRNEITINELARAVIEQYFLPIVSGRLEVTVRDAEHEYGITGETIFDTVSKLEWDTKGISTKNEISALLRLAKWQAGLPVDDYVLLNKIGIGGNFALTRDNFPKGLLIKLSDAFAGKSRIALRIPIEITSTDGVSSNEDFRIVLERDESLRSSNIPHLRSGINISRMRTQGPSNVRGLCLIGLEQEQGPLDKLLQASEGPAHTNWEQRGEGFDKAKSLYPDAYKVIISMRNIVRKLAELLAAPEDKQDLRTLSQFFPDLESADLGASGQSGGTNRGSSNSAKDANPVPPGTIEGRIRSLAPMLRGLRVVESATIVVRSSNGGSIETITDAEGIFRVDQLMSSDYEITAHKENLGIAQKKVILPVDHGLHIEMILRPSPKPRLFLKERLIDGFEIRGNPQYEGGLRRVRVRLAYAAWGGIKSFNPADFSLRDEKLRIAFQGIQEKERHQIVLSENTLEFLPILQDFYLQVRGFDKNRALHVDAKALADEFQSEGDAQ